MMTEEEKMRRDAANAAKYGCAACSCCGHQFDNWMTEAENGGRRRRPVIKHPHERRIDFDENGARIRIPYYRILPCASCPEQFKDEFWARQAHDEEVAWMLQNGF
jgi:hypothetical protein